MFKEQGYFPEQAEALQRTLSRLVRSCPVPSSVHRIAGVDCAYSPGDDTCAAAVAVWDPETGTLVEQGSVLRPAQLPYHPGLLGFREAPSLIEVLATLVTPPEVVICDGHGVAHPRRFGLACHVGLLTGLPTIGCAKSRLCGTFVSPGEARGSSSPLLDDGRTIGSVLRTREGVRPLFVSVGHRVDLPGAVRLVLESTTRYRLPEPLRAAHRLASETLRSTGA
jgi:deoxyribonuclease V